MASAPRGSPGDQSMNMRTAGGPKKKRKPGGGSKGADSWGGETTDRVGRGRDDEDGEGKDSDMIPEAIAALLFDHELYFEKHARAGKMIDTEGMDGIDAFLADFYMESSLVKPDGDDPKNEYRAVIESSTHRRVHIPTARPMHQLLHSMQPNIYEAPAGTMGYDLGSAAWEVVSKNTCYSDRDRSYIANGIARETEKMLAFAARFSKTRVGEMDMVFQPGFRKGLPGIEEEKRRRALEDFKPADTFAQAETDWEVEAVVDEDQL